MVYIATKMSQCRFARAPSILLHILCLRFPDDYVIHFAGRKVSNFNTAKRQAHSLQWQCALHVLFEIYIFHFYTYICSYNQEKYFPGTLRLRFSAIRFLSLLAFYPSFLVSSSAQSSKQERKLLIFAPSFSSHQTLLSIVKSSILGM